MDPRSIPPPSFKVFVGIDFGSGPDRSVTIFMCPKCSYITELTDNILLDGVSRCYYCDCSVGVNLLTGEVTLIYDPETDGPSKNNDGF